jgi:membrane protein
VSSKAGSVAAGSVKAGSVKAGSLKHRVTHRIDNIRGRSPLIDHVFRTVAHYSAVNGSIQAGAVTYFGFLSFFPILALAFAVVGYVAKVFPDAQEDLVKAIGTVLPHLVGEEPGEIRLDQIQRAAPSIFSIGLVAVLYSGLGWLSGMRDALLVVFEKPAKEQPNFVVGKLRDVLALVSLGVVLMVSVAVSGVFTSLSDKILRWLDLGAGLGPVVDLVAIVVGLLASMVLFYAFFRLLAEPDLPKRSLWAGALLGALGFEVLKQASRYLLAATANQPAFQAFGIALILLVWINYFSRVVMYAAAWAYTTPEALELRERAEAEAKLDERRQTATTRVDLSKAPGVMARPGRAAIAEAYAAGGLSALGLIALLTRKKKDDS